jgi:hypothetical protein
MKEHGIKREHGGESGNGDVHYPGNKISYWYKPRTIVGEYGDYQAKQGFEYPILFAIDAVHSTDLKAGFGYGMHSQGERSIDNYPDFLPLERITHVFAPSFKVSELRSLLIAHGHGQIKVQPLRQPVVENR